MNKIKKRRKKDRLQNFEALLIAFRGDNNSISTFRNAFKEQATQSSDTILNDIGFGKS